MTKSMHPGISIALFLSQQGGADSVIGACALMQAMHERWPFLHFHIFTTVSAAVFKKRLGSFFSYHWYPAALWQAQNPGFAPDHAAARNCPVGSLPASEGGSELLADMLADMECLLVLSDAPQWGLAAAKKAGIPWQKFENFTEPAILESCRQNLPELFAAAPDAEDAGKMKMTADLLCRWTAARHELLDVVSPGGETLGAAPRCKIHGNNAWLHRVVHVLVFDDGNRLLLQKRSVNKTVAPGKWDTSVGGHVDCGEPVESAMRREMAEELGMHPKAPRFAYRYVHSNDFESELVHTYICQASGSIRFNPDEIDAVRFWELSEITKNLGNACFSDNFEQEFDLYCQWSKQLSYTVRDV